MLMQHTIERLHTLRLTAMAKALEHQMARAQSSELSFEERFTFLVDSEFTSRESKKVTRLLRAAKLKHQAMLEDIVYTSRPGLDRSLISSLSQCEWIRQHLNLTITGSTGSGKTWLACAFAHQACRNLISSLYTWIPTLINDLEISHADGSFRKKLQQYTKIDLLILDDFGLKPLSPSASHDLLEVIDARVNGKSTIITSQYPIENWHGLIGDPTIADAILDRVVHSAHRIELSGESMRKRKRDV
jgi:DNA replication protein DnaC